MTYLNRAMALAFVISAVGCVPPTEKTEIGKNAPAERVAVASTENSYAADIKAMEANIRPSKTDGQFFDYY